MGFPIDNNLISLWRQDDSEWIFFGLDPVHFTFNSSIIYLNQVG